ncbi:MAG: hypothetical protein V7637_2009 [Mycobacteriales bacterium]
MIRRLAAAVAVAGAAAALGGCVAPAPTLSAYESKAARTAHDALSAVETAQLAFTASQQGRLTRQYLGVVLSESEDAFGSVQQTFDSVQPPDAGAADTMRDDLDKLLSDGSDALSQLRIAARRQRTADMAEASRALRPVATGLERFAREHAQ